MSEPHPIPTVYLPATVDRPAEPAPYLMTEDEVARLLRIDGNADVYQALKRYRAKGWLRATQMGKCVRFQLPDVIRCLQTAREENPR